MPTSLLCKENTPGRKKKPNGEPGEWQNEPEALGADSWAALPLPVLGWPFGSPLRLPSAVF